MSHTVLGPLAFWEGYESELTTLAIYALGLAIYALFVGTFYRTLSRRNLFRRQAWTMKTPGPMRFLVLFPLMSFGQFIVLSLALFFLAKPVEGVAELQRVQDILLLSMALVVGVRVAAYISENASEDLAKLVPLGLLGVLLVDPGYLQLSTPFDRMAELPGLVDLIARYFLVLVVLEGLLRFAWTVTGGRTRERIREQRIAEATRRQAAAAAGVPERPKEPDTSWPPKGGA